ncbi:MAG: hypothetical protein K9J06_07020 [Flavobacteriales bacterium]|nr:hypothetical protein [Flavobacteriales bacterium]
MKKEDVPQDDGKLLEGKFRVVKYAVDDEGHFDKVGSVGWEPENVVMEQAWDDINQRVESARQKFLRGESSPLRFHMEKNLMDIGMLSSYMDMTRLRVWWHMRPAAFSKLSASTLQRYADVFQITADELKTVDSSPNA